MAPRWSCTAGDAARGSAVVDSITAEGGKARFVAADLTDLAQLDDLVDRAGTVDVLVNNAGFSWFGPTADLDVATFDRLFAANVRAPYFLVGALAPKMAGRGGGSIVSIASIASMAGQVGLAGGAAYGATKATLASMTRSWAAEFSPSACYLTFLAAGFLLGVIPLDGLSHVVAGGRAAVLRSGRAAGAGFAGFRRAGQIGECLADVAEPAADPGGVSRPGGQGCCQGSRMSAARPRARRSWT